MNCNSETEEETIAVKKKRARRVSFAETTSVHIFDRDEESESPPDPKPNSTDVNPTELGLFNDELGFRRKVFLQNDEEYDDDEEEDDDIDARGSFLRPMESPSSGSGFGSATSNDEDNFFGPVSASFIRPGRLSDSAPSNENHEVTMDSTAFSMNFRSLAKSDSGGELLTSTGVHLTFDEKTPTQDPIPINQGNTMVLTVDKKPNLQSSPPTAKMRSNSDSNDMSLVGEISRRYDYGGLSPGLDKLLAQTSKDLQASVDRSYLVQSRNIETGLSPNAHLVAHTNVDGEEYNEMVGYTTQDANRPTDIVSVKQNVSNIGCGTKSNLDNKHHELGGSELQACNSPLISSLNSLSPKQREIAESSFNLSKSPWRATPPQKYASYIASSDDRVHKAGASSIQKSISRLELLQASPFSANLSAKIGSSNLKPLHHIPRTPLESMWNNKVANTKDADGDRTAELLNSPSLNVFEEKGHCKQDSKIGSPKDIVCVVPAEALRIPLKSSASPCSVSAANPCANQQNKESGSVTFPPQSLWICESSEQLILSPEDPSKVKLVTFENYSSMMEVTLESMEGQGAIGKPHKFLEGNSSVVPDYQGIKSQAEAGLRGDAVNASLIAETLDKKQSFLIHSTVPSSSPVLHIIHSKGLPEAKNPGDQDFNLPAFQGNFGTIKNSPTPLEHHESDIFHCRTPKKDSQTKIGQVNTRNARVGEAGEVAFCSSTVSISQKSANDLTIRKNLVKLFTQSPTGNEERNLNCSSNIHPISIVENLSPSSNQVTAVVEDSARKRSNEEITPRDETSRTQKSPKLCKGGMCKSEVLKPSSVGDNKRSTDGCVFKHWVDIQAKISQLANNLISLPADKLSFQSIDAVEDILVHLMRKQKYQMLLADMQSQKSPELAISCSTHQHKRVVEAKLLLHKLMQEQAKLQLLRLKRDLSLKKVQTVRSGVQESQMLRSNHFLLHPPKSLHIQVDIRYQGFDDAQLQSAHDKVTTLRQVLIDLERRITKLTESFLLLYKIKGQPDSADMVVLVNDYLKKRMCFRFSRLDMQLWDVDHLDSRNEHYTIILNYLGLITQRLHVTVRPLSVVCVSYELNDMNIIKNLPCVDARTAFTYVFDVEAIRKYVRSRSLAEETQISSLLLGNLLDVVEEVQLARLELRNLIQITFYSQSVEQLDLQLCFINTKSGKKAILTFNLCCLKRGVYPSEILPSHMEFLAEYKQKFCSKKLLADVRAAVQSLRVGYFRIIRACRCISKVFEAANIEEYLTA